MKKTGKVILIVLAVIAVGGRTAWKAVRASAAVSCTVPELPAVTCYSEQERVFTAMSLSCLVYGCETCDAPSGTVSEIIYRENPGIIAENADIRRTDPSDPLTALIDSGAFIRQTAGEFRFLTGLKDSKSSFYGAAFADDAGKVVWLAYSGSVDLTDALQSVKLVTGAGLSRQEKCAFELYESVLETDEIVNGGYGLVLTGHSLGGALASMVSCVSGCEAVTVSGADGLAVDKITAITGAGREKYSISNYMTSPEKGEHSFKNLLQKVMFWGTYDGIECHVYADNGLTENAHCIFSFIEFADGDMSGPVLPAFETGTR